MGWEVSGISSWATVSRGATGGCWRRERESGEGERGVWVKRATTQLLHFFYRMYVSSQLTEFCTDINRFVFVQNT